MARNNAFYNSLDEVSTDGRFDQSKMHWPRKGQKLLKEPTSRTPENGKACVNWLLSWKNEILLADSYKDGADQLVEAILKGGDGGHADCFIYPILYLYRHAVEVQLKLLIRHAVAINLIPDDEKTEECLASHALYPLWNRVSAALSKMWPAGDPSELSAVEGMISQLHAADPSGSHLRYTHSINGAPMDPTLPDWIDLANLREVFDGLWGLLGGSYDAFDHTLSLQYEMERELAAGS